MDRALPGINKKGNQSVVTIFLDFDRVLTPIPPRVRGGVDWLSKRPTFEKAIRPWLRHVEIVVSSSWRSVIALDDIRKGFAPDVADRIIFATGPDLGDRRKEIEQWVAENERSFWIAVDDHAGPFSNCLGRLVAIDRTIGFTEEDGAALAVKLHAFIHGDAQDIISLISP